ncbi:hypothetical protein LCGC14_1512030, partial [marine sediment metagenome]
HAFEVELLAVCKSEKEFKSTEYFWQLFYNKKANKDGYDLNINQKFNPILGSRFDDLQKFNIPKYRLTTDLLNGFELSDLILKYKSKKAIKTNSKNYYFGLTDLFKIKAYLVEPYIHKCLMLGYTRDETISYLIKSGFKMFDKDTINQLQGLNYKQNRVTPEKLFNNILDFLYGPPRRRSSSSGGSRFEQLREVYFINPFVEYLKSIDTKSFIEREVRYYRDSLGHFTLKDLESYTIDANRFSIIEHLIMHNIKQTEIGIQLGLFERNSEADLKHRGTDKIRRYLESRWKLALETAGIRYSIKNLAIFLKTHFLNNNAYTNYLSRND